MHLNICSKPELFSSLHYGLQYLKSFYTNRLSFESQYKPLNLFSLGQSKSENNNQIITLTDKNKTLCQTYLRNHCKIESANKMTTLTVITISRLQLNKQ